MRSTDTEEVNSPAASSDAAAGHTETAPRHSERGETVAVADFRQAVLPWRAPRPAGHAVLTSLHTHAHSYPVHLNQRMVHNTHIYTGHHILFQKDSELTEKYWQPAFLRKA